MPQNQNSVDKIQGVLFDLDGTLLDSAPGILATLYHILDLHKLPKKDKQTLNPYIGQGLTTLFQQCAPRLTLEQCQHHAKEGFLHYIKNAHTNTLPYSGAEDILHFLNQRQTPWGIVTNKTRKLMKAVIHKLPYHETAKIIVCADDLDVKKPNPKPLLYAAEKLQSNPKNTLYIGDALVDMQAAVTANMNGLIAQYGYVSQDYKNWPHQGILANLLEIKQWLD